MVSDRGLHAVVDWGMSKCSYSAYALSFDLDGIEI